MIHQNALQGIWAIREPRADFQWELHRAPTGDRPAARCPLNADGEIEPVERGAHALKLQVLAFGLDLKLPGNQLHLGQGRHGLRLRPRSSFPAERKKEGVVIEVKPQARSLETHFLEPVLLPPEEP